MRYIPDTDSSDYIEAKQERDAQRAYMQERLAHPDPRDPDHPGDLGDDES